MRDLDMKRRPSPVGKLERRLSRRKQRLRGERLNTFILILALVIFCVGIVVHGRRRALDPPDRKPIVQHR